MNEGALLNLTHRMRSVEEHLNLTRNHRFTRLEDWAHERRLLGASTDKQIVKLMEESGELARHHLRGDREKLKDALGDTLTTVIILSAQLGFTAEECLDHAWAEIKDRTGSCTTGTFIKD